VLTIPITIISLGLFLFIINAIMVYLASKMVSGFKIDGFGWALLFSLILSIVSYFFGAHDAPVIF
jgi:putative membrane protein